MKKFLTVYPRNYGVNYEINPWMEGQVGNVDQFLAKKQWLALIDVLKTIPDVEIQYDLYQPEETPDMVFTANAGLVLGKTIFLSNFHHPQRQPEKALFKEYFEEKGYAIAELPKHVSFEGAGDALFDSLGNLFIGNGFRSSKEATKYFDRIARGYVYSLTLIDPRFYHLDTCFCPLSKNYISRDYLYYPGAFDYSALRYIHSLRSHWTELLNMIEVSEEDALNFACNAINVNEYVILNRASQGLKDQLSERGYKVIETPLTEFIKAGGSAKCLTLEIGEE